MPQEIMHIMFEGAIPYVIGHLLKYFILTEKAFALAQMNRRLREFNYGYTQMADKLQKISEDMLRADWGDEGLSTIISIWTTCCQKLVVFTYPDIHYWRLDCVRILPVREFSLTRLDCIFVALFPTVLNLFTLFVRATTSQRSPITLFVRS